MQISRASDYAVRVMIHLAGLPSGSIASQAELSKETGVSEDFLLKVLQRLVRERLIRSQRGSEGGYALAVPPTTLTLIQVVESMEGPIRLNQCLGEEPTCERKPWCPAHEIWAQAQMLMLHLLGGVSIADLANRAKNMPIRHQRPHLKPISISVLSEKPK